jgi:hypothetical protein
MEKLLNNSWKLQKSILDLPRLNLTFADLFKKIFQ